MSSTSISNLLWNSSWVSKSFEARPNQRAPCKHAFENRNSEAILAWQCQVRKFQLNHRYKPPNLRQLCITIPIWCKLLDTTPCLNSLISCISLFPCSAKMLMPFLYATNCAFDGNMHWCFEFLSLLDPDVGLFNRAVLRVGAVLQRRQQSFEAFLYFTATIGSAGYVEKAIMGCMWPQQTPGNKSSSN